MKVYIVGSGLSSGGNQKIDMEFYLEFDDDTAFNFAEFFEQTVSIGTDILENEGFTVPATSVEFN